MDERQREIIIKLIKQEWENICQAYDKDAEDYEACEHANEVIRQELDSIIDEVCN